MKSSQLLIKTSSRQYPILIGNEILNKVTKLIKLRLPNVKKVAVIFDKKLPKKILSKLILSLKNYEIQTFKLNSKDKIKNIKVATNLIEKIIKNNFNRSDCIVSLGGGVVGDLSAFVSSVTKRGINFINIPSTLLAQVDASVGGKTGINSRQGKNLIGTFYQPEFIIADISLLDSLPYREMICGYGEILKHALILDKKFFFWLDKNGDKIIKKNKNSLKYAIIKSCKIKSKIVNADEKEKNIRMILNFGHTFGHAFEATKKFSNKLNHGEAVLLGMMIACEFSYEKKLLKYNDLVAIKKHYSNLKLPCNIKDFFKKKDVNKITNFMIKDKKNFSRKINLILIKKIGKTFKPGKTLISIPEIRRFLKLKL
jgi:3-dehydroquinate synthase